MYFYCFHLLYLVCLFLHITVEAPEAVKITSLSNPPREVYLVQVGDETPQIYVQEPQTVLESVKVSDHFYFKEAFRIY